MWATLFENFPVAQFKISNLKMIHDMLKIQNIYVGLELYYCD